MRKKIKWALTLFVAILGVTSMAEKQPSYFKTELLTHRSRADYENYLNITKNRIAVTPHGGAGCLVAQRRRHGHFRGHPALFWLQHVCR